jgi:RHS repeat-associated protein
MTRFIRAGWFARASFAVAPPIRHIATVAALWLLGGALAHAQTPGATTTYGYDETGNRTSQVDAQGRKTAWTFDGKNRVTSKTLPDGSKETRSYDSVNNLLSWTTFAGEVFSLQYNSNNFPTGQIIPGGARTNSGIPGGSVVSSFTPYGLVTFRQEQGPTTLDGAQTFRYDLNDRLLESKSPIGQISYTISPVSEVLERSVSGVGTVKYEFDAARRLLKVVAADGKQVRHSYDGGGRLFLIERDLNPKNGQTQFVRTSITLDPADRLTEIMHVKIAGSAVTYIAGQQVTRKPGGAVTRIATLRGDGSTATLSGFTSVTTLIQDFEYDGMARLTRELRSNIRGSTDVRYEYDLVGNRTKKTVTSSAGTEVTTYSFDVNDRLTQESTTLPSGGTRLITYGWDGNGNLASKTEAGRVTLYRFDPRSKLIDIRTGPTQATAEAAAPMVRYAYDASGNRIRKWGAQPSTYLIDANSPFAQVARETAGAESVDYVRGLGLIRQIRNTAAGPEDLYPLAGHLGTSLGAVSAAGDLVEQLDTDAFGNFEQSGSRQTHLFAGEYWDQDSQLLYLRARWYDPKIGRFVSPDPLEGKRRDPRSLNRYSYGNADPVNMRDPSGKMTLTELAVGMTAVVAIAMIAQPKMALPTATRLGDWIASQMAPSGRGIDHTVVSQSTGWGADGNRERPDQTDENEAIATTGEEGCEHLRWAIRTLEERINMRLEDLERHPEDRNNVIGRGHRARIEILRGHLERLRALVFLVCGSSS